MTVYLPVVPPYVFDKFGFFFYILSWIVVSYTIKHELFVEQPIESALSPYTCLLVSTDIQVHVLLVLSLLAVADNLAQI